MPVPDGWFDYSPFNDNIKGTRIIPVKTPLKETFNNGLSRKMMKDIGGVPLEEEFTPTQLMERLHAKGYELGLVIDLTNTFRYYNGETFETVGVSYYKIKCPGQEIPPDHVYNELATKLKSFLSQQGHRLVAVHCTHGLNRTGYLICRYLIEECSFDVEGAIKAFSVARGHSIERGYYLESLRKRYQIDWRHSNDSHSSQERPSPKKKDRDHEMSHSRRDTSKIERFSRSDACVNWRRSPYSCHHHSYSRDLLSCSEPQTDSWSQEWKPRREQPWRSQHPRACFNEDRPIPKPRYVNDKNPSGYERNCQQDGEYHDRYGVSDSSDLKRMSEHSRGKTSIHKPTSPDRCGDWRRASSYHCHESSSSQDRV